MLFNTKHSPLASEGEYCSKDGMRSVKSYGEALVRSERGSVSLTLEQHVLVVCDSGLSSVESGSRYCFTLRFSVFSILATLL